MSKKSIQNGMDCCFSSAASCQRRLKAMARDLISFQDRGMAGVGKQTPRAKAAAVRGTLTAGARRAARAGGGRLAASPTLRF